MFIVYLLLAVVFGLPLIVWVLAENTGDSILREHVFPENGQVYRYRIKLNHWLPRLTPWHEDAFTPGDTMFCLTDCPPDLEAHEFYHVTRNALYGRVQRVFYILRDYVTRGYFKSFEESAARGFAILYQDQFTGAK